MAETAFQRRVNQRKRRFWWDARDVGIAAEQVTETARTFTIIAVTERQRPVILRAINAQRLRSSSTGDSIKVYF